MSLADDRDPSEGDTRVDLQTRLMADEAVDLHDTLKQTFMALAVKRFAELRAIDPGLVDLFADDEFVEREARVMWDACIDSAHLSRLRRIAKTGRDDQ